MAGEHNSNEPDDSPGRTMVGVQRVSHEAAAAPLDVEDPGGTLVGFSPVRPPPPAARADVSSEATIIGMRRLAVPPLGPANAAYEPEAPVAPVGRPFEGHGGPNFGSLAMPLEQGAAAGGTMVGMARAAPAPYAPPSFDAGGTMVGMGRVAPVPPGFPLPAPEAGSTMLGVGRVPFPAPFGGATPSAGSTMLGVGRVPSPSGFAPRAPDAGATMVGVGRVPMPRSFAPGAPDAGSTMMGIGRVPLPSTNPFGTPVVPVGQTMVGVATFKAADDYAHEPEPAAGGTMVGMRSVAFGGPSDAPTYGEGLSFGDPGSTEPAMAEEPASYGAWPEAAVSEEEAPTPVSSSAGTAHPSGPPPAYEILKHLGGGDLGQVFHAVHRESGVTVALRIIRPDIAAVPGAVEALRDVVSLAQAAQHTHLGQQFDLDETATPTLILEYVPGRTLANLMQERGLAPPSAVVDLGVRICSALAAAHGAGLAHGRVHAGNIVLEENTGRWVLLDLGHGYAVQGLEPTHDLYALGAMLYELATGHSPFELGETPPDPRSYVDTLPGVLSALLLRSLAPDPALWFGSAVEFAQALGRARARG